MAINIGFDKYVRWSPKQRAILWFAIAAVVCGAYYFVWFAPKREEIKALEQQSAALVTQIAEKKAIADNLESVKAAVAQMDALLSQALVKLPTGEEIPKLLKTISDLAKETGLESLLFKPNPPVPVGPEFFYATITLEMEQNGSFYDLGRFFDKISRLPRIVTIENISVVNPDSGKSEAGVLKATFQAQTFKYLTPQERPKKEVPKTEKGGSK